MQEPPNRVVPLPDERIGRISGEEHYEKNVGIDLLRGSGIGYFSRFRSL
jgi:hypothetical protein